MTPSSSEESQSEVYIDDTIVFGGESEREEDPSLIKDARCQPEVHSRAGKAASSPTGAAKNEREGVRLSEMSTITAFSIQSVRKTEEEIREDAPMGGEIPIERFFQFEEWREPVGGQESFYGDEDFGPVYVQTDASERSVGAYVFQLEADGVTRRPLSSLTRTLSENGGTPEREKYSVFYVLKEWEHHLRGRKFILRIDHVNRTYIDFEGTANMKSWKTHIQEFCFRIEYLPGK